MKAITKNIVMGVVIGVLSALGGMIIQKDLFSGSCRGCLPINKQYPEYARVGDNDALFIGAAGVGDLETVKYFLQYEDINVNMTDKEGATALMYAIDHGHVEIVRLLLEHGASVSMHTNGQWGSWTPLTIAIVQYDYDTAELMGPLRFTWLGSYKKNEVREQLISLLLQYGADINQTITIKGPMARDFAQKEEIAGVTPLILAAGLLRPNIVKFLLEKGANMGKKSSVGTAVDIAQSSTFSDWDIKPEEAKEAIILMTSIDG